MKYKLLVIALFFTCKLFCQTLNEGYIVEHNKLIDAEYTIYNPPLKINKTLSQSKIDYSKIEGLIQSYFSASNKQWALDEYLDKSTKIVRDEEHFEAVKKSSNQDFIQIETIYEFDYSNHKMAYVKYSFIFEKIPFPVIGIISIEKVNNRWYISDLLNQGALLFILSKMDTPFLLDMFKGKSLDKEINDFIKNNSDKSQIIDFINFYKNIEKLKVNNPTFFKKIIDQRLIKENIDFRNAQEKSTPSTTKFKIYQPFLYDNVQLFEYNKSEVNLTKIDKAFEKYLNTPESIIIDDIPINLLFKVKIVIGNEQYVLIKFEKEKKKYVSAIKTNNGIFSIVNLQELQVITDICLMSKYSFLKSILDNKNYQMQEDITGSDGGINVSEALKYINLNEASLSKYLDE
ncbi:hypothetical protein OIU80_06060 [Flavobacterium sp. LS1R47]|uniref:DUF3828 domain-containing protein n=1 Tax=Flavobacterium frigoritolerans TaxID=2987686 RepID=A0A9X3C8K9_9FLAO|nr:hypothetical protein [Flavobacterium frigoritolerans]MCV9931843.1 hypothetical protein [Flavobacterium frigoritolerans]